MQRMCEWLGIRAKDAKTKYQPITVVGTVVTLILTIPAGILVWQLIKNDTPPTGGDFLWFFLLGVSSIITLILYLIWRVPKLRFDKTCAPKQKQIRL